MKVGIADDNERHLKRIKEEIEKIPYIEIVIEAESEKNFRERYEQIEQKNGDVDVLLLDIEMENPYSGIEIATEYKKPVFFISGNNQKDLPKIEELKNDLEWVDFYSKPIVKYEMFQKRFKDFCHKVLKSNEEHKIVCSCIDGKRIMDVDNVVLVCVIDKIEERKLVLLKDGEKIEIKDRDSFDKIASNWSKSKSKFVKINKRTCVNKLFSSHEKGKDSIVLKNISIEPKDISISILKNCGIDDPGILNLGKNFPVKAEEW